MELLSYINKISNKDIIENLCDNRVAVHVCTEAECYEALRRFEEAGVRVKPGLISSCWKGHGSELCFSISKWNIPNRKEKYQLWQGSCERYRRSKYSICEYKDLVSKGVV